MTPGTLSRMPNQPRTPLHSFRCDDHLWNTAKTKARSNGETIADVLRRALDTYQGEAATRRPNASSYTRNLRANDLALSEFLLTSSEDPALSSGRRSYILGALLGHVDPETFAGILADAERCMRSS